MTNLSAVQITFLLIFRTMCVIMYLPNNERRLSYEGMRYLWLLPDDGLRAGLFPAGE